MLRVMPVPGEPTTFRCEGTSLQCSCPECAKLFKRTPPDQVRFSLRQQTVLRALGVWGKVQRHLVALEKAYVPRYRVEQRCHKCGEGTLQLVFHTVDLKGYGDAGQCDCQFHQYTLAPKLSRMDPAQQCGASDLRCAHVDASREFFCDLMLRMHTHSREDAA